ncbi:hypothetical protein V6P92_00935 [Dickeya ananatis]
MTWDEKPTRTEQLAALPTPSLILDESIMLSNIARLRNRPELTGITLRPHLKTGKIARGCPPSTD